MSEAETVLLVAEAYDDANPVCERTPDELFYDEGATEIELRTWQVPYAIGVYRSVRVVHFEDGSRLEEDTEPAWDSRHAPRVSIWCAYE